MRNQLFNILTAFACLSVALYIVSLIYKDIANEKYKRSRRKQLIKKIKEAKLMKRGKLIMSKCVLYERFADWRSTIPGIEHQRNKYCLSMFNSKGTPATIFASLAKAVLLTVTKGTYYNGYEAYEQR